MLESIEVIRDVNWRSYLCESHCSSYLCEGHCRSYLCEGHWRMPLCVVHLSCLFPRVTWSFLKVLESNLYTKVIEVQV